VIIDLLADQIGAIAERLQTFHAYAEATLDQVLGPAAATALRLGANSAEQLVWHHRGTRFEPVPLPREAQLAPAIAPVVGDFDGDGHEDLILSQNFFPTDLNTPRYDAGRALLLEGDGRGGFAAVPGQISGLLVYGDQRGAASADVDGDGRLDLAITQNGAATVLLHNDRATPGIRIVLEGSPDNPRAIGAQLRIQLAADAWGPAREVQAGSGYWSSSGATQVLAVPPGARAVKVRWPGGRETTTPIAPGQRLAHISLPR
jgi:hypothetical protein